MAAQNSSLAQLVCINLKVSILHLTLLPPYWTVVLPYIHKFPHRVTTKVDLCTSVLYSLYQLSSRHVKEVRHVQLTYQSRSAKTQILDEFTFVNINEICILNYTSIFSLSFILYNPLWKYDLRSAYVRLTELLKTKVLYFGNFNKEA
jgi:hypothetical protein